MLPMSLQEWVKSEAFTRDGCVNPEYRDLYLDIGFFTVQFAACELNITALLQVATQSNDPKSFDLLVSGMDARVKVSRFRQAAKLYSSLGPLLSERLDVFERQAIKLRNKLAHGTLIPSKDPQVYEIVSVLKQPESVSNRTDRHERPERIRSDRIWQLGAWLNLFAFDLAHAMLVWGFNSEFELRTPRTPVLLAGIP